MLAYILGGAAYLYIAFMGAFGKFQLKQEF